MDHEQKLITYLLFIKIFANNYNQANLNFRFPKP